MKEFLSALIVIAVYMLPTIVAFQRGHASKWAIMMLNIFLGWTLIVWFTAFIWALANKGHNVTYVYSKD